MKTFKTKIGYEILSFIIIVFAIIITTAVYKGASKDTLFTLGGILTLVMAVILYLMFSTEYIVTERKLIIKCGFLKKTELNIDDIKSIERSNSILASPSPSLDRIELGYGKFDSVLVSPKDKITFAKVLTEINPNIDNKVTE